MKQLHTIDLSLDKSKENSYLSDTLIEHISACLKNGEKTLLYLNKRGKFSSYICEECSYIHTCPNCDLSLNIHTGPERLICHHCFYEQRLTNTCPKCQGVKLKKIGVGTEQIEASIHKLFPQASIYRFDTDNLKTVSAKKQAGEKLKTTDIIIGTKMITTGFNIEKLALIGVILVEQELNIPRYNTEEQVYSNLRQLLGRGGRVGQKTQVILQSYAVNNPLIKSLTEKNYKDFFLETLEERKLFSYPPFCELAYIIYKHADSQKSSAYMKGFFDKLQKNNTNSLDICLVEKTIKRNNKFFSKIIIKGNGLRLFLEPLRKEILRNSDLAVVFEN